jgi:hypothetical protein
VASCPATTTRLRVDRPRPQEMAATRYKTGPYPPGLSRHARLRDFHHWFTRVTPSELARQTRIVWSCRYVPPLSGLLPTLSGVPRIELPPASANRCDGLQVESSHLHMVKWRLVAHVMGGVHSKNPAQVPLAEDRHPVRDLGLDSQHEALGDAVRPRTPRRDPTNLNTAPSASQRERHHRAGRATEERAARRHHGTLDRHVAPRMPATV